MATGSRAVGVAWRVTLSPLLDPALSLMWKAGRGRIKSSEGSNHEPLEKVHRFRGSCPCVGARHSVAGGGQLPGACASSRCDATCVLYETVSAVLTATWRCLPTLLLFFCLSPWDSKSCEGGKNWAEACSAILCRGEAFTTAC